MKRLAMCVWVCLLAGTALSTVFPPEVSKEDVASLMRATEWVRSLDEDALLRLVPEKTGLRFTDCPNCEGGRQEGQLAWTPEHPDEVYCRYCKHSYPSPKFPMNKTLRVRNPRGEVQEYPYWEDSKGYRHFFLARHDAEVRDYLAESARSLALLWAATGERTYARRAALILFRFAQVFPGWCYRYDMPFQQKEFFEGDITPARLRYGYRTARWSHWCYSDLRQELIDAYDWLHDSGIFTDLSREKGVNVAKCIERDLFRNTADMVLANPETYHNMSPSPWTSLILLGRVIGEPHYVHEPVRRMREFFDRRFFYDASWAEGSPSYWWQVLTNMGNAARMLRGYPDPPFYRDPVDGTRLDNANISDAFPELERSRRGLLKMRLPDGRRVPVHDTWPARAEDPTKESRPYLLPALGHACLGGGTGDRQFQFHLTWSGGYIHAHADNLSLLVWAYGRELLSDIGYTHTRYHAWTVHTASHNTVVVDGENQSIRAPELGTAGSLRWFDASSGWVQTVSANGARGYAEKAKLYRRTLIVVNHDEPYAVDVFEVEGGRTRDYFLHGDADTSSLAETSLKLSILPTLLPSGMKWSPPLNEAETRMEQPGYPYGFLRNLREGAMPPGEVPVVLRAGNKAGISANLLGNGGGRLVLGTNPSIRLADENDAQLEKFQRAFLMWRDASANGKSLFAAVLDPFSEHKRVRRVRRIPVKGAALVVEVSDGTRTDYIVYSAPRRVAIPAGGLKAEFQGAVGVLSLNAGKVEGAYALGQGGWRCGSFRRVSQGPSSFELKTADRESLLIAGAVDAPPAGAVIRLITSDGWVYPYTVASAAREFGGIRVRVQELTGLRFDAAQKRLRLVSFPGREHQGPVRVEWLAPSF
ncbi:MAG: heparinase II/III family protein [Bryobacteraceae bacterium]